LVPFKRDVAGDEDDNDDRSVVELTMAFSGTGKPKEGLPYYVSAVDKKLQKYRQSKQFIEFPNLSILYTDFIKEFHVHEYTVDDEDRDTMVAYHSDRKETKETKKTFPVYIVRHGEAIHNVPGILKYARQLINYDTSLTTLGIKQARETGQELKELLKKTKSRVTKAFVSDLTRTHQTANFILENFVERMRPESLIVVPCIHEVSDEASNDYENCDATKPSIFNRSKENYHKVLDKSLPNDHFEKYKLGIDWGFYNSFYQTLLGTDKRKNDDLSRQICQKNYNLYSAIHDANQWDLVRSRWDTLDRPSPRKNWTRLESKSPDTESVAASGIEETKTVAASGIKETKTVPASGIEEAKTVAASGIEETKTEELTSPGNEQNSKFGGSKRTTRKSGKRSNRSTRKSGKRFKISTRKSGKRSKISTRKR
jgi:bisphosphoglycerate-dependent phosphoglycerate mutase